MKSCPVCKTTLFEDMDTCYGCMYRFGSSPELEEKALSSGQGDSGGESNKQPSCQLGGKGCLFSDFLVEFERFLRDFLVNRAVQVK